MTKFRADFSIQGNGSYAGNLIYFYNNSEIGNLPSDVQIDGDVDISNLNLNDYVVYNITKIQWNIDGFFYGNEDVSHVFKLSGIHQVQLKVWSEQFIDINGEPFYFTHTIYKDVEVKSRFLKLIKDNDPTLELKNVPETEDFYYAAATLFERIYKDTQGVFDLWDANEIPPEYFEHLSLTLGHDSLYSQKVGYNRELDVKFSDYNIYDRIKLGAATPEEIRFFRRFLLLSSDIFSSKGSPVNIEAFLSFFSIEGKAIELWTKTWGQTPIGETHENFIGFDIEDNKLNLAWNNLRVIGNCNENSFIKKTLNGIIIDNFHKVQKLEYDSDVVNETSDGWVEFELDQTYPYFLGIYKQDGNYLVPRESYLEEHKYYNVVPNNPPRNDVTKPEIIQINPDVLDYGDVLSVPYRLYATDEEGQSLFVNSMIATKDENVKDCDISVKWRFIDPDDSNKDESLRYTEDELFVAVRGVPKEDDLYAHFNEYYRISVNGRRSTTSLTKIVESDTEDEVINQKINLSGDIENPIYDLVITEAHLTDVCEEESECNTYEFVKGRFYEILIQINGSLISAYVRENDSDTQIQENIDSDRGGSMYGIESTKPWTPLFENINLDIKDESIESLDSEGNDVINVSYAPILVGGNYGVGCRNSIIEIEEVTLDVLDPDERLYDSAQKELNLKPKYLEWLGQKLIRFNNNRDNKKSFTNVISDSYDSSVTEYNLKENETEALEFVYFDDVTVNENIATRYSVTFNENWVKSNFSSPQELKEKIIIPYGSQKMWWMPEQRQFNTNIYKNYFGLDPSTYCETAETTGTTGTTGSSGQPECNDNINIIPGLYSYNESSPLDTYNLQPNDDLSYLNRGDSGTTFSNVFNWSEKMIQYHFSGKGISYQGVFQEVAPLSTRFPTLDGTFELDNGEFFENRVFQPIVYEGQNSNRVVGVRFKNCDDINRIISSLSTDLSVDVQLYGEYEFELTKESVKYRPDRNELKQGVTSDYVRVKIFIPIGVLSPSIRTYSLNTEFLHETSNSGTNYIRMTGAYVRIPREMTTFREDSIYEIELSQEAINPYESVELGLECKHFMSAQIQMAGGIEITGIDEDSFPTTYILDDNTRNILEQVTSKIRNKDDYFNCSQKYNFDDDFKWWMPTEVWRKREFSKRTPNVLEDILTNINYSPNNDFTKFFYNYEIKPGSPKPKALTFSITDGPVNPNTLYYAKLVVNFDFSGFNYNNINKPEEVDNALNDEELSRLNVLEGTKSPYTDFSRSPTVTCLTFYVPISWYPSGDVPKNNTIEWFNYITGSTGENGNSPSITISPMGLMTYLINNSGESNKGNVTSTQIVDDMISVTKGWSIQDWNTLFDTHVDVELIAEKIPDSEVKLYEKYSFNRSFPLNVGAFIDINYNIADEESLEWEVLDDFRMFSSGPNQVDFDVPGILQNLRYWVEDVKSVTLNNFIVNPSLYKLPNNELLKFNDTKTFENFNGSTLNGRWFFDIFFDEDTKIVTKEDEFNPNLRREINWLPYEADSNNIYSVTKRKPSSDLVFNTNDSTYNLVSINNEYAIQSINSNTALDIDYGKSGDGNRNNNEIVFSKDEQTNIKKLYMVDDNNIIFDVETTVYFDPAMNRKKNFKGKKFELILKANNEYDSVRNKNVLGGYYFVGIGTFGFDISLGLAQYNNDTGKMEHSFLAGFGEYNTKGVKTGQWYKLRAIVTPDYVRVIFNDVRDPDRMIINYNIDNLIHDDPNRYNKGNFEELSYLANGLKSLDITYPDTLQDKINNTFKEDNYNEELVRSYRPSGSRAGILFFNELTYVGSVTYRSKVSNSKIFGDSSDKTDLSEILNKIKNEFNVDGEITYVSKTLKGNLVILAGDKLFYKNVNQPLALYDENIKNVIVEGKNVIVVFNENRGNDVQIVKENFTDYKSLFVKDDTFYYDHIYKYLEFTDRTVNEVWVDSNTMHIEFTDPYSD